MLGYDGNSVNIIKKARHSCTGTEVAFIYEVDSVMDRFVVRAYDKGMLTLSDNVKLLFNSSSKCQGFDFAGTLHSAIVLKLGTSESDWESLAVFDCKEDISYSRGHF